MCGIAGFTAPGSDARRLVAAMNAALAHRGPDGAGIFIDRDIALGHTRLAIIDPRGGAQPRVDPRSGDALVFNGEIYGHAALADELRRGGTPFRDRSDTETLFNLIRRDGVRRAIDRIDGMFAFAFRDGATGTLYLARDRLGEKPLYYGTAQGALVFGSEVAAVRVHPAFRNAELDRIAAYRFLMFEYCPGIDSGWSGIAKLEPGTMLAFRDGGIAIERYWRPRIGGAVATERDAVERLDGLLRDSVRRRLIADVPVGVFLSGGLDSSLIAAVGSELERGLSAFTVRIGGSGFDESAHAVAVATHLGLRHEIVELGDDDLRGAFDAVSSRLGEPLADSSLLPSFLVSGAARRHMTVALGGDGADELFAGYPNFAMQRLAPLMRHVPRSLGRVLRLAAAALPGGGYMNWPFLLSQLSQGFGAPTERQSALWMAPFDQIDAARLWRSPATAQSETVFAPLEAWAGEMAGLSEVARLLFVFLVTYLPEDILAKGDRASMMHGLELRSPFLDRNFVDYACALPSSLKLRRGTRKYVLKQVARRYLPEPIVARKKHGFAVPIGNLIRTLFWERCRDVLLSPTNPVAGWFRRGAIEALLSQHRHGTDHGKKIWALYILFSVASRPAPTLPTGLALSAAE
ncbi:MAG: asparagine synthase (glutamine-hydrolyzing) [Alphaproteobacteria bacterium]|nr:asparagine synthase (glutamine-hydrolyzing) [Alphaproteobacteria bacterium]